MAKCRKKPMVVDTWQWLFNDRQEKPPVWMDDALGRWPEIGGAAFEPDHVDGPRIRLATLEGVMTAIPGTFIMRGVQGEIYPCKPDIFEQTYDLEESPMEEPYEPPNKQAEEAIRAVFNDTSVPRKDETAVNLRQLREKIDGFLDALESDT